MSSLPGFSKVFKRGKTVVINNYCGSHCANLPLPLKESVKIHSLLGIGKNQDVILVWNSANEELTVDRDSFGEVDCASSCLIFYGCQSGKYHVRTKCAKIYLLSCLNSVIVMEEESKIFTSTVEITLCTELRILINTKICTIQADQMKDCSIIVREDCFGNPSLLFKNGYDYGNDGMLVWVGCDGVSLRVGNECLSCDFDSERRKDSTASRESSQFQVRRDASGKLQTYAFLSYGNGYLVEKDPSRTETCFIEEGDEESESDEDEEKEEGVYLIPEDEMR